MVCVTGDVIKFFIRILLLDQKVTASVRGDYDVPSENADCASGPTIQPTMDFNSCISKNEQSTIATQQEDNRRSGAPSDDVNNTSGNKGSGHGWIITMYSGVYSLAIVLYVGYLMCDITCTI